MQKNEIRPVAPCTTNTTKSKQTKDLKVKCETWKLLEEIIATTLQDIGVGKDFLNRTLIYPEIKSSG